MLNRLERADARMTTLACEKPAWIPFGPTLNVAARPHPANPDFLQRPRLIALSTGFCSFKTLAAAHEFELFSAADRLHHPT